MRKTGSLCKFGYRHCRHTATKEILFLY